MKIVVISSLFDPISTWHEKLVNILLEANKFDEAWLMPSTGDAHRLAMCRLAVADDGFKFTRSKVKVVPLQDAKKLTNDFKDSHFSFVKEALGMDFDHKAPEELKFWAGEPQTVQITPFPDLRDLLVCGDTKAAEFLCPSVIGYVRGNNLYPLDPVRYVNGRK